MIDNYFLNRRTIRQYESRPVDPAIVDALLDAAAHAPNTGNMQLYSIVVTKDPDALQRLHPLHFSQPAATGAPLLLTFCADLNRYTRWCELSGADAGAGNLQMLLCSVMDTVIVAQQFTTLAEREGLGVCWLGTTLYNAPQIAAELSLPRLTLPVITLAVGWPASEGTKSDRLPLDAWRHNGSYDQAQNIAALYADKESLPENQQFVADNNLSSLAQVFAKVRYPRANSEAFSATLADFLAQQGFYK